MTEVIVKSNPMPAIIKMVVQGRRALGEQWREITIRPTPEGRLTLENQAAKAPPNNTPVVVPGLGNLSDEHLNFILEGALKAQDYYRRRKVRPTPAQIQREVQQMWLDFCEQKLRFLKGTTSIGAGGIFQREKPGIQNWSGIHE